MGCFVCARDSSLTMSGAVVLKYTKQIEKRWENFEEIQCMISKLQEKRLQTVFTKVGGEVDDICEGSVVEWRA